MSGTIIDQDQKRVYDASAFDENRSFIQFRDNELLITDLGGRVPDERQTEIINKARKSQYSGLMTRQAQKRMTRAITLLSQSHPAKWIVNQVSGRHQYFKLSLITLTISAQKNIDHKEAYKKLLAPFLKWVRYTLGCRSYVWKAELQERGQLHYHLILPKFIHYKVLRDKWNRLQRDNGYLREYVSKTKKIDPNSTDIKAIGNEKNVSKYIIKYLAKGEAVNLLKEKLKAEQDLREKKITREQYQEIEDRFYQGTPKIEGKLWDCSENLNDKYFTVAMTWRLSMVLKDYLNENPMIAFYGERFCMIHVDFANPPPFMQLVMKRYRDYLHCIKMGGQKWLNELKK